MILYQQWLKESKYLVINTKSDKIVSVIKTNEKIDSIKETGYFGIYYSKTGKHTYYINPRKCRFMNKLLKSAYEFDYYKFIYRCRKDKLKKINEYATTYCYRTF